VSRVRKFNSLLNDVTILNFPLIGKLLRRYYLISITIPAIALGVSVYFYSIQNVLYETNVGFSDASTKNLSPTNTIADLVGENQIIIAEEDVLAMRNDWAFNQKLAKKIYKLPDLYSMDFNSVNTRNKISTNVLLEKCQHDEECTIRTLLGPLPGLYNIIAEATPGRYRLLVVTLEEKTAKIILREVAKLIEEDRVSYLKNVVEKKIEATEKLIKQQNVDIDADNMMNLSNRQVNLKNQIEEIKNGMRNLSQSIANNKLQFNTLELELAQFNKSKSIGAADSKRVNYEKYVKLNQEVLDLRTNISLLTQNTAMSEYEKKVVIELEARLQGKLSEIEKLGDVSRSVSGIDKFNETQDSKSNYTQKDYNVLREKIKKEQAEYDKTKEDLDKFQVEYAEVSRKLDDMKPNTGYLDLLEKKLISLKLLASTISTDLVVDNIGNNVKIHKNAALSKYLVFATISSVFFIFLLTVIRYLFDQKIYSEDDVKVFFEDLEVIGNTPEFEK